MASAQAASHQTEGQGPSIRYPPHILLDEEFVDMNTCGICHHILNTPCQVHQCGHIFCERCIVSLLQDTKKVECPGCKNENPSEVHYIADELYNKDYASNRQLQRLRVQCKNHHEGCKWQGKLKDYEAHVSTCDFGVEVCECGGKFPRNKLSLHRDTDCQHPKNKRKCKFGCHNEEIPDGVLPEEHEADSVVQHIRFLFEDVCTFRDTTREKVRELSEKIDQAEEQLKLKTPSTSSATANLPDASTIPVSSENNAFVEEVRKNMNVMEEKTKVSHNMFTVLIKEVQQVAVRLVDSERKIQLAIQERDNLLGEMRVAVAKGPTSMNGTLIWIIDDVGRRFQESVNADQASMLSAPFYTSRAGYKLCARLYMNGDGIGRGRYLSLFLVVMKSTHDSFLQWPFHRFVTFTLMDQSGRSQHVKDSFRTDPASSSFRRPRTEMNIASGCPRFMSLSDLRTKWESYVCDDTMIIKIEVDTQGLDNFGGQAA